MRKINRETIAQHLIEYQLEMIGRTMLDIFDDDKWEFNLTMTRVQREEFKKYAIPLLMKTLKCNRTKATATYEWFISQFGFRLKD